MKILVINAGSSSLKAQLIDSQTSKVYAKCTCERIGLDASFIKFESDKGKTKLDYVMREHTDAIKGLIELLLSEDYGCISNMSEIDAIGHRMVHGGEKFTKSVVVDEPLMKVLEEMIPLAPLHNPANIVGIRACMEAMPNKKNVVVFDTAFHATMPKKAYMYAIPYDMYTNHQIRRYGFHGSSHRYVSEKLGEMLGGLQGKKVISCHLGNGSSITAVKDGKSVDTSMGYTPLAGVVMGTRSGDIDPAIVQQIMKIKGFDIDQAVQYLNKQSGLFGINGESSDMRDIDEKCQTDARYKLSFDMLCYSIKKYIGAYTAVMGGVDAIIFTGGIGENDELVRAEVMKDMEYLGVDFDFEKNSTMPRGTTECITKPGSKVQVYRIPTDEEFIIARDTEMLVK
ncbi:MAG: acetate kinase [Clostridia bacterium]|nr:acetate kinase [Clostridia bacterium]